MLTNESKAMVRRTLIQCMCPVSRTVELILKFCLDKDNSVRLAAYSKIGKVPVKLLKIVQRQFYLRTAFSSENDMIKKIVTVKVLPQWVSFYGNYCEFLKALKLNATEEDFKQTTLLVENVLGVMFKNDTMKVMLESLPPLTQEKLIPESELGFETALLWRRLVQHLQLTDESEKYLEQIMPEVTHLIPYVKK